MGIRRVAFDLGSNLGWAILADDGTITHGAIEFKRGKTGGARYLGFLQWLTAMHKENEAIAEVVYEAVHRHLGTDAAHVYGGMEAIVLAWAERHGYRVRTVGVNTWKAALGIKGGAGKPAVTAAIRKRGYTIKSQDEADAIGILLSTLKDRT